MFLSLQAFFHEKSSSLAKAGQGWSTSAASASLCRSEHKWGSNFMSEQQSRGMSAILNEDWENNLGSVHQETWDSLKKTHMCMYIHSYWHDYIYIYVSLTWWGQWQVANCWDGSGFFFFFLPQEGCDDHQKQFLSEKAREGWEPTTDSLGWTLGERWVVERLTLGKASVGDMGTVFHSMYTHIYIHMYIIWCESMKICKKSWNH